MAQVQSIAHEVIDRLNFYQSNGGELSQFDQRRLIRDIEALKSADLSSGLMAFGIYYALMGDKARSIESHEKSLAASGRSAPYLVNYGVTLVGFQRFSAAFNIFEEALRKDPANSSVVKYMAQLAFYTGNITKFRSALSFHLKAVPESDAMEFSSVLSTLAFFEDMASLGITEEDALATFSHLESVYGGHDLMPVGAVSSLNDADGHEYLSVEIKVNCAGGTLAEINDRISSLVSEDLSISSWNKLVCTFIYSDESANIFQE